MTADRPTTEPRRIAVTVIGTNLVMDYGDEEAARAAMDALAAAQGVAPHDPDVLRCRNCGMPWDDHEGAAPRYGTIVDSAQGDDSATSVSSENGGNLTIEEYNVPSMPSEYSEGAAPRAFCQSCGYAHPVDDADCIERAAPRAEGLPHDPEWPRRTLLHEGVLEQFGRVEWGDPDSDGFYTPAIYAAQWAAPHEHEWTAGTQPGPYPGLPEATCIAPGHEGAAPRAEGLDVMTDSELSMLKAAIVKEEQHRYRLSRPSDEPEDSDDR